MAWTQMQPEGDKLSYQAEADTRSLGKVNDGQDPGLNRLSRATVTSDRTDNCRLNRDLGALPKGEAVTRVSASLQIRATARSSGRARRANAQIWAQAERWPRGRPGGVRKSSV